MPKNPSNIESDANAVFVLQAGISLLKTGKRATPKDAIDVISAPQFRAVLQNGITTDAGVNLPGWDFKTVDDGTVAAVFVTLAYLGVVLDPNQVKQIMLVFANS